MALFGTDGVRGVAGEFLTAEVAMKLGRAATLTLAAEHPQVLIVRDTRESGEMLEAALAAGIAAGGGHALLGGVLPTPGASVLVRRYGFDMAAVVSASHNPYCDNGIKFFGPEGMKTSDEQEAEIERRLEEPSARIGRLRAHPFGAGARLAGAASAEDQPGGPRRAVRRELRRALMRMGEQFPEFEKPLTKRRRQAHDEQGPVGFGQIHQCV